MEKRTDHYTIIIKAYIPSVLLDIHLSSSLNADCKQTLMEYQVVVLTNVQWKRCIAVHNNNNNNMFFDKPLPCEPILMIY